MAQYVEVAHIASLIAPRMYCAKYSADNDRARFYIFLRLPESK